MPLNEFYVYSPELDNYAEQLLISNCVESVGYEWPVPWQDTDYPQPLDFNSIGFRLFTVETAKRWGYDFAPPANEESARLWREFVEVTDSYFPNAELDQTLLDCTDEVRAVDTEFMSNFDGVNYLFQLSRQANQVTLQDDAVVKATAAWRECLAPQVDFPLPDDPREGMPPTEAMKIWRSDGDGASAAEIADAIADAECRESSGLSAAAYEKNWEEQQKLVAENRDKLERIRAEAVERKKMLLTIVAENAPEAP
ncbi:hypothetical protein AB3M89_02875 [Microbacterium sp. 179-I 3D2 NHS]|uniref:hypothetical protein n=1 Tax=Microbacterium sp. 179-I 3D2 NHS TaxID=3235178 RepID=UPI0039A29C70